jgi:plastocyanin
VTLPTRLIASLAIFLALSAGAFVARQAAAQESIAVPVGDFFFCAESFENGVCETAVAEGSTVNWTFGGSTTHTTTSDDALWDSGGISSGTFQFTFTEPGTYLYRCSIHPTQMMGRIEVLPAPAEPTATPRATAVVDLVAPATPTSGPGLPPTGQGGGTASAGWWLVAGAVVAGLGLSTLGAGYAAMRRRG